MLRISLSCKREKGKHFICIIICHLPLIFLTKLTENNEKGKNGENVENISI